MGTGSRMLDDFPGANLPPEAVLLFAVRLIATVRLHATCLVSSSHMLQAQ